MSSLLEIAPENLTVEVGGHQHTVCGLTLRDITELLRRFPDLLKLFAGGDEATDQIAAVIPDLAAAVIASGMGNPGDDAEEAAAARLSAEMQSKLFGAILKLTMPAGIGPFVAGLVAAFGGQAATSPEASPRPSQSSSRQAIAA